MNNRISNKDKRDWLNFLKSNEKLEDKEKTNKNKVIKSSRTIDLHGYTLEEANKAVEHFINTSYRENINKVIVVTGKGLHSNNKNNPYVSKDLSILKYSVPKFIYDNKNLMINILKIEEAKIEDGGSGAFYIYLKKNKK